MFALLVQQSPKVKPVLLTMPSAFFPYLTGVNNSCFTKVKVLPQALLLIGLYRHMDLCPFYNNENFDYRWIADAIKSWCHFLHRIGHSLLVNHSCFR